jgi:hypothetical protein
MMQVGIGTFDIEIEVMMVDEFSKTWVMPKLISVGGFKFKPIHNFIPQTIHSKVLLMVVELMKIHLLFHLVKILLKDITPLVETEDIAITKTSLSNG